MNYFLEDNVQPFSIASVVYQRSSEQISYNRARSKIEKLSACSTNVDCLAFICAGFSTYIS